jgi:hypothetical protein
MTASDTTASIAFLTIRELDAIGYCGGLLVLNERGHPLEFHCNAPVQPTRSQEILYGSTLRSYLLGEVIALKLLEACTCPPAALLTDLPGLVELSDTIAVPIGYVPPAGEGSTEEAPPSGWNWMELSGQRIGRPAGRPDDAARLESALGRYARQLPLAEPFQRILNALAEANTSVRQRESA